MGMNLIDSEFRVWWKVIDKNSECMMISVILDYIMYNCLYIIKFEFLFFIFFKLECFIL